MPIRRVFFDWSRPALRVAAGYLWEQYGAPATLDLERVIVAVPGGRAGRRLLQALVELGEQQSAALVPPRIVTAGQLPELLYEVKRPFAGDLAQQLAWIRAIKATRPQEIDRLIKRLPADGDLAGWLALAQTFAELHRELAADALDFSHVLKRGPELDGFLEAARWKTLAALEQRYLQILDRLDLWDIQTARLFAIEHRLCRTECDIVLVAMVDMDRTVRGMLDQVADRVTALVLAPESLADRFDGHGCLLAPAWREMPLAIERRQIDVVAGPAEQADAVVRAIAAWDGAYSADEITIGVPDERVLPYLEERLAEAGIPARFGAGTPLARSGPAVLLAALAEQVELGSYRCLAALLRHPDLDDWLKRRGIDDDYLTALDGYYSDRLPAAGGAEWLGDSPEAESVRRVGAALGELVQPLSGDRRLLSDWAEPILNLVVEIYGQRELDRELERDRLILAASEAIADCLAEYRQIDAQLAPRTTGAEALRIVLSRIGSMRVPPPGQGGEVELLGWLELPLDDARALVVTGLNEGIVPASQNGDPFLPDRLRTALALDDNDRRYARDSYALAVLAASRAELKLIAGRRTSDRDPLAPSRLLFACGAEELALRAKEFFSPGAPSRRLLLPQSPRAGRTSTDLPIPQPSPLVRPVTSLRVTEFRDFLACPYRYYLRHRLSLESVTDAAEELDAGQFGALMHEVLKQFGESLLADCTSSVELGKGLGDLLDKVVSEKFGEQTLAVVRIQVEQIRLRLSAFADWQAGWRGAGWRIHATEREVKGQACALLVDGQPMYLRGRIDRIDVHESDGQTLVFDYKSGDAAQTPDNSHRDQGAWIDLQLPLYRHLAKALGIPGPVRLGYILLPKNTADTRHELAAWSEDELLAADEQAFEVIRKIRAEKFWPPAGEPTAFSADLAAICQDDVFAAASLAADEAEDDET